MFDLQPFPLLPAGAIRHGISRALTNYEPALRPALKAGGYLTRDSRVVERKKYGKAGARFGHRFVEFVFGLRVGHSAAPRLDVGDAILDHEDIGAPAIVEQGPIGNRDPRAYLRGGDRSAQRLSGAEPGAGR